MAILGEIRKRPKILIIVIGLALLAFLLMDTGMGGDTPPDTNIYGTVNGEVVTRKDYENTLSVLRRNPQARNMPDYLLRQQAWESTVQNSLIVEHFRKAGLEMNPEILLRFNPQLRDEINRLQAQAAEGDKQAQEILNNRLPQVMSASESQLAAQLYNSLLRTTQLTNSLEVKNELANQSKNATIEYARVEYNQYNVENPTEVSDDDLQQYINEHPLRFKREANTTFQYAYFKNTPSVEDSVRINHNIMAYLNGGYQLDENGEKLDSIPPFKSAANDSLYISEYTDEPFNPTFYGYQQLSQMVGPEVANWVKSATIGEIRGPYNSAGDRVLTKLSAKKGNDSIQAKHILIAYNEVNPNVSRSKEEAQTLADKLLEEAQANPSNFDALVQENSDDSSKSNGGVVGWTTESQPTFVPQFQNYLVNNPVGKIGLVESQFGYHILVATDKKPGVAYQLASIAIKMKSSEKTSKQLYNIANKFFNEVDGKDLQSFVDIATENKYTQQEAKNITRFAGVIPGLGTDEDQEIISWTFNKDTQLGDTKLFSDVNGDYIVAKLNNKTEKGIAKPEDVKSEIEITVRNQKIAQKLISELEGKSLEEVAKMGGAEVQSASVSMARPVIEGAGNEPKIIGVVFAQEPNTTSQPLEGNSGVFVVKTQSFNTMDNNPNVNEEAIKQNLQRQGQTDLGVITRYMRKNAEVDDERSKIFR